MAPLLGAVTGATVLVTGAGGSIGRALARRLFELPLAKLILLDRSEADLFEIGAALRDQATLVLGDVADRRAMEEVIARHRPSLVWHTAALKHVVMLESHPVEGVRTNVLGTRNLLSVAAEYGVKRLVTASTDKAVAPTSVMGATKRLAELDALSHTPSPVAIPARMVNVFGSRGSVATTFERAFAEGRPATLRHPTATRWFMTERDATSLLLAGAWLGEPGQILIPEVGAPVPIHSVLRWCAERAGREVTADSLPLRDGEKVHERLLHELERDRPSSLPGIRVIEAGDRNPVSLEALEDAVARRDRQQLLLELSALVSGYVPSKTALGSEV